MERLLKQKEVKVNKETLVKSKGLKYFRMFIIINIPFNILNKHSCKLMYVNINDFVSLHSLLQVSNLEHVILV